MFNWNKSREEKVTSTDKLYGLVLAGGKSTRMKTDKGQLNYHGVPQREYLYTLLKTVCDKVFMSVRIDQSQDFNEDVNLIVDENKYLGPFNGLMSAHHFDKSAAWMVLACDMPFVNGKAIQKLISERDPATLVTAYASINNNLPEPLCAIWEAPALNLAKKYIEAGNKASPSRFLLNNTIKIVNPEQELVLLNVNSKSDYKEVVEKLKEIERK